MEMRSFRDDDYEAVCDFLITLNAENRLHINWNWARFEWMYGHPEFDWESKECIGLWWDAGRIVGAAIYDMYFGEAFCGMLPGYEALYPDILDYAWQKLRTGTDSVLRSEMMIRKRSPLPSRTDLPGRNRPKRSW